MEDDRVLTSCCVGTVEDEEVGEPRDHCPLVRFSAACGIPYIVDLLSSYALDLDRVQPLLRHETRCVDNDVCWESVAFVGLDVFRADLDHPLLAKVHVGRVQAGEVCRRVHATLAAGLVVGLQDFSVLLWGIVLDVAHCVLSDVVPHAQPAVGHQKRVEDVLELPGKDETVYPRRKGYICHGKFPRR